MLVDTSHLDDGTPSTAADGGADVATITPTVDAGTDASDGRVPKVFPPDAAVWSTNGHAYEALYLPGTTWPEAKVLAQGKGGYLATLTSVDETAFVWLVVKSADPRVVVSDYQGPWIGGMQMPNVMQPDAGWTWVTGEPWSYTAWASDEPTDGFNGENETVLGFISGPTWADYPIEFPLDGYVVEYDP